MVAEEDLACNRCNHLIGAERKATEELALSSGSSRSRLWWPNVHIVMCERCLAHEALSRVRGVNEGAL